MKLSYLFRRCLSISYLHTEEGGDYALERIGDTLYIYLESSDGREDWRNNLKFSAEAYRREGRVEWFAHRGFLKVWRSVEPRLVPYIEDMTLKSIVCVGYSHGAALALLCHEAIGFHRPDLRGSVRSYGFGCPRVIRGTLSAEIAVRWARFTVVRIPDDIVTHLPPSFLGYIHVGAMLELGEAGRYSPTDAHRSQNILAELDRMNL